MNIDILKDTVLEKTTPKLRAVIKDEAGQAIPAASLLTLKLTYYRLKDATVVINGRDAQNVLNLNNVTVDAGGNLTWHMQVSDTTIQDQTLIKDVHRAIFEWTYSADGYTKTGRHVIDIPILNLERV